MGLGLELDNISRHFLGNVGLVVGGVNAGFVDVDGVGPEVSHVTWMAVLLCCGSLPAGNIASVGMGLGGLDNGVDGGVGDDVIGLPGVSSVIVMLVWPGLAPSPLC